MLVNTYAPGVPPEAWESKLESDVVLAVSSQSMRLLLARKLAQDPRVDAPSILRRLWPF